MEDKKCNNEGAETTAKSIFPSCAYDMYGFTSGYHEHGYPPPSAYPSHGYPPLAYPPQGYSSHGYTPQGYSSHGYPTPAYPPAGYPGRYGYPAGHKPSIGSMLADGAAAAYAAHRMSHGSHHLTHGHGRYDSHWYGQHGKYKHGKFKHGKFHKPGGFGYYGKFRKWK